MALKALKFQPPKNKIIRKIMLSFKLLKKMIGVGLCLVLVLIPFQRGLADMGSAPIGEEGSQFTSTTNDIDSKQPTNPSTDNKSNDNDDLKGPLSTIIPISVQTSASFINGDQQESLSISIQVDSDGKQAVVTVSGIVPALGNYNESYSGVFDAGKKTIEADSTNGKAFIVIQLTGDKNNYQIQTYQKTDTAFLTPFENQIASSSSVYQFENDVLKSVDHSNYDFGAGFQSGTNPALASTVLQKRHWEVTQKTIDAVSQSFVTAITSERNVVNKDQGISPVFIEKSKEFINYDAQGQMTKNVQLRFSKQNQFWTAKSWELKNKIETETSIQLYTDENIALYDEIKSIDDFLRVSSANNLAPYTIKGVSASMAISANFNDGIPASQELYIKDINTNKWILKSSMGPTIPSVVEPFTTQAYVPSIRSGRELNVTVVVKANGIAEITTSTSNEIITGSYDADTQTVTGVNSEGGAPMTYVIKMTQDSSGNYQIKSYQTDFANFQFKGNFFHAVYGFENGLFKTYDTDYVSPIGTSDRHRIEHVIYQTIRIDGAIKYFLTADINKSSRPAQSILSDWPSGRPIPFSENDQFVISESKEFNQYDAQGKLLKSILIYNYPNADMQQNKEWVAYSQERSSEEKTITTRLIKSPTQSNDILFDSIQSTDNIVELDAINYAVTTSQNKTVTIYKDESLTQLDHADAYTKVADTSDWMLVLPDGAIVIPPLVPLDAPKFTPADPSKTNALDNSKQDFPVTPSLIPGSGTLLTPTITTTGNMGGLKSADFIPSSSNEIPKSLPVLTTNGGLTAELTPPTSPIVQIPNQDGEEPQQEVVTGDKNPPDTSPEKSSANEPRVTQPGITPLQKEALLSPIKNIEIDPLDKKAFISDLGILADLIARRPASSKLAAAEFMDYLKFLQVVLARLVKLAEKYSGRADVQKAIDTVIDNIFNQIQKESSEIRMGAEENNSDMIIFEELLKKDPAISDQWTLNEAMQAAMVKAASGSNFDARINAVLEVLRRGAAREKSTAIERAIYRDWYFKVAKRARKIRIQRLQEMRNESSRAVEPMTASTEK